jgi:molybdenum cofactor cytidylyltransferase
MCALGVPRGTVAIVPAAGRSSRFGSMKLLARVGDDHLIDRTVASLLDAHVTQLLLVTAAHVDLSETRSLGDPRVVRLTNPAPERGMFSSIQVGLGALNDAAVVLILPADMPFVRPSTIEAVTVECERTGQSVVAAHAGRRGHPLALPGALVPALLKASPAGSLRDALTSLGAVVTAVEVDDPGVLRDVDVPSDLM